MGAGAWGVGRVSSAIVTAEPSEDFAVALTRVLDPASPAFGSETLVGMVLGGLVVAFLGLLGLVFTSRASRRRSEAMMAGLRSERAEESARLADMLRDSVRDIVGGASREALIDNSRTFLTLAETRLAEQSKDSGQVLDTSRRAITGELGRLTQKLEKMETLVHELEAERQRGLGEVARAVTESTQRTDALHRTTEELRRVLSSPSARGQWGEWMAESMLDLVGLRRGVDYERQLTMEKSGTRPDFTFRLPKGLSLNMDVKFPFDNYWAYLEARSDAEGERAAKAFLADVRRRVKEVTTRDYVDPEGGTVDFVLVFVPNEQVFAFLQERDRDLVEEAFRKRVILCSPFTLYALLSIIRQSVSVFALEQRTKEVVSVMRELESAWRAYVGGMDKVAKKLDEAQTEFSTLATTRKRRIDRVLSKALVGDDGRAEEPAAQVDADGRASADAVRVIRKICGRTTRALRPAPRAERSNDTRAAVARRACDGSKTCPLVTPRR